MDIRENKEKNETQNPENMKIRDLKSSENKTEEVKKPLTVEEADKRVEKKIFGEGEIEDKLNKNKEVSFGAVGCEGYCAKKHDGTYVHGTYHLN